MSDELARRIRSLEAERLRPVPPPPGTRPRINLYDLAELVEALGDEESGVPADDPAHGLLGQPVLDQPRDLGGAEAVAGGAADGRAELLPRTIPRALGAAKRPAVPGEVIADVIHGHMVPQSAPDCPSGPD